MKCEYVFGIPYVTDYIYIDTIWLFVSLLFSVSSVMLFFGVCVCLCVVLSTVCSVFTTHNSCSVWRCAKQFRIHKLSNRHFEKPPQKNCAIFMQIHCSTDSLLICVKISHSSFACRSNLSLHPDTNQLWKATTTNTLLIVLRL